MDGAITFLEEDPTGLQSLRDRAKAAFLVHLVALATGVSPVEIARETRARNPAARARWLAMYLLHTTLSVPVMRVAAAFGRDRSTVGQVMGRVEDWRTDPGFDEVVSALERCALAAPLEAPAEILSMDDGAGRRGVPA